MRRGLVPILAIVLAMAGFGGDARAEPVLTREVALDRVGIDFGWDPIWVLGVGYSRGWPGALRGHDARLGLRYEAPVALWPGCGAWRLMASGTAMVRLPWWLGIATSVDTGVVRARDVTGERTGWSLELGTQAGLFRWAWSLGLDLRWRTVPLVSVRPSSVVAETFDERYPEGTTGSGPSAPASGVLAFPSHTLLLGAVVGGRVLRRMGLFARGGWAWQPQRQGLLSHPALGQMPFYVQAGVDVRW